MNGKVYIVGAGPGDPSLITVRGLEALRRADVVLHDRLAAPELLAAAPQGAETVFVGKEPGRHALSQAEINELMAARARQGLIVVRLKGGDPFIFGRGGEEADFLARQGIEFEIIPGVTAACGAGAFTGVALTDRNSSSLVTFVTAREGEGASPGVDWAALARLGGTLAVYMGRGNLRETAARLVENGLAADTPCLVVERATLPAQRTVHATLAEVAAACAQAGLEPPCMVIVGAVAGGYPAASWFERLPLFGRHIVVTRPEGRQEALLHSYRALGARVTHFPTIEIVPEAPARLAEGIARVPEADWLVFTSANGVATFFDALRRAGRDARFLGGKRVAAIGTATEAALAEAGVFADFVPDEFTSAGLLAGLKDASRRQEVFLLWRADAAGPELPEGLRAAGRCVVEFTAYRIAKPSFADDSPVEEMCAAPPDAIVFSSGMTAANFIEIAGRERALSIARSAALVSIGPLTSAALREAGLKVAAEAHPHTWRGLLAATLEALGAGPVPGWLRL